LFPLPWLLTLLGEKAVRCGDGTVRGRMLLDDDIVARDGDSALVPNPIPSPPIPSPPLR
jgi:hypothetical protein